jgi:D-sedoheptulose 7-phosphate isomerase
MDVVRIRFAELKDILPEFEEISAFAITSAAQLVANTFKSGHKILICGNGGSAADAQHLAAEFVNSMSKDIERTGLPAISLSADSSIITAVANDRDFSQIFSRQVEALGNRDDVLVIFSTSGESKNCINAFRLAKNKGLKTILFTGRESSISKQASISIQVPTSNTQHIQEFHVIAYHIMVELVENILYKGLLIK